MNASEVLDLATAHMRLSDSLKSLSLSNPVYGATTKAMTAIADTITHACTPEKDTP